MSEEEKYNNRQRIGRLIAELRQEKDLSVIKLAEKSGVSRQNIYKIEDGKYNVSIDILVKICRALDSELTIKGS